MLNPALAAGKFYDALVAIPRWALLPPGVAAQAVQRSAFPGATRPPSRPRPSWSAAYWVGPDAARRRSRGPTRELAALATLACPDQGGADLPRGPGRPWTRRGCPPASRCRPTRCSAPWCRCALAQVGKPYVWGAKGPDAFDCSGLTQAAWASAGVADLGRDDQPGPRRCAGHRARPTLAPGDLLFIPGSFGTAAVPRHVGIYVGDGLVVDARSARRGVILSSLADWRAQVVAIRRVTPISPAAVAPAAG